MMTCGCAVQQHGAEASRTQEMSDSLASGALRMVDISDADWLTVRAYRIARTTVQAEAERDRAMVERLKTMHRGGRR
jgi:hypothetical protein